MKTAQCPKSRTGPQPTRFSRRSYPWTSFCSSNSVVSRWCPWEIGYADGCKPNESIWIVQTQENGNVYGNEYLNLYRSVDYSDKNDLGVWEPGLTTGGTVLKCA